MENTFTSDSLNAMFDEMKSAYALKKDDVSIPEKFTESLQQYISDKGKDFDKIANRFFEFLIGQPAIFPNINNSLKNLLATFEAASQANDKALSPLQTDEISAYNMAACYEKVGDIQLAEKYYQEAIELAPTDIFYYKALSACYRNNNQKEAIINLYKDAISNYNTIPGFIFELAYAYGEDEKYDESINYYDKLSAFKDYRDLSIALNNKGYSYLRLNNLNEAIKCYEEAIRLNPQDPLSYLSYARALAPSDKNKAVEYFKKAIDLSPQDITVYRELSNLYINNNQKDKVIDLYKEAILKFNDVPDFYFELGYFYFNEGDFVESIHYYDKVLEFNEYPDRCAALNNKGLSLFQLNKNDAAIECYKECILLNPGYTLAFVNYARALAPSDKNKAVEYIKKAIDLSPRDITIYKELADLYISNNQKETVIDLYKEAILKFSDAPEFYFELGNVYATEEKFAESIIYYDKSLEFVDYADRYIAFNNKGFSSFKLNHNEEAIKCFEACILLNPGYALAFVNYARTLAPSDKDKAAAYYKKAIDLSPRDITVYRELADLYSNNNQKEKVIDLYKEAVLKFTDVPEFYFELGYLHANEGNFAESITYYDKVLEFKDYPDRYAVLNNKGLSLSQLNKIDAAIECYKESLRLNPQYAIAYYNYGLSIVPSDEDDAMNQFKTAISLDPYYAEAQDQLFNLLNKNEDFDTMKNVFKDVISRQKKPMGISYFYLAYAQQALNEDIDALANYTEAYNNDKTITGALTNIAIISRKQNNQKETIKCYEILIKDNPDVYANYSTYAYFLLQQNRRDDAIALIEKTLKSKDELAAKYYDLGNIYLAGFAYETAIQTYDKALTEDENSVFAQHNKAWIYEKLGDFKSAKTAWAKAAELYEKINNEGQASADMLCYFAEVLFYSMQSDDYENIESYYVKALALDDKNIAPYLSLVNFYQLKQEVSEDNKAREETLQGQRNEDRRKMLGYYITGIGLLKKRLEKDQAKEDLLMLGSFYLAMSKNDEAIDNFKKALEKDENYIQAYSSLGVALVRNEQYKDAIKNFNYSLDLDPDDLNMQSNLGDAYRKAEMYDKSEETFRKILYICPAYIDALVGLAECFKTLGDKAVDEKDMNKAEEYFSNARDLLDKTLNLSGDGASKRFKKAEKSAIYYSSGYTKVRLFELKGGFNLRLLQSAKRDFEHIQNTQDEYFKARKAIRKINQKIYEVFSVKKGAPLIIFIIAILLFCTMQYSYFFNRYTTKEVLFVNKTELEDFLQKNKLDTTQKNIEAISDESFSDMDELDSKLSSFIPASYLSNLPAPVVKKDKIILKENISEVAYGLFTFGSLLFMVVGLFLRDITRLKVGSIEMDKNAADNVSVTQPLVGK
jgi:tetratricopeptide (TPR) repeat protein